MGKGGSMTTYDAADKAARLHDRLRDEPWFVTVERGKGCLVVYASDMLAAQKTVPKAFEGVDVYVVQCGKPVPA